MDLSKEPLRRVEKPSHGRNKPKRGNATKFSPKVRKSIVDRDGGLCVMCRRPYHSIHHIIFASAGGRGEETNGVCVCADCHTIAHGSRKGRTWFEDYRIKYLLGDETA